ncbi:MAG: glucose-1-phosphate cytidylyltransferase [Actinomycetota bacterium]
MQAVILCGGLGTRMREETEFRPKPMVEIGGRPILWHIMKTYAHHGITEFVLCLGYKGSMIKDYFLNYETTSNDFTVRLGRKDRIHFHGAHNEGDWSVTLVDTGPDTNTGGRVKRIEPFINGDRFLVTYGDGVGDVDISATVLHHESHGKLATVSVVRPITRFGIADLDPSDRVLSFREKPVSEDWVSAGFFVFERGVFEYLDDDCVLEKEPFERLSKDGQVAAYRHHGFWHPMDTFRELQMLAGIWETGAAPWKVWS